MERKHFTGTVRQQIPSPITAILDTTGYKNAMRCTNILSAHGNDIHVCSPAQGNSSNLTQKFHIRAVDVMFGSLA
jgi:hypothetical protein